ncbi:MAG: hypothetical protein IJQ84_05925 [Paludibacteraceae bacterium]|nr:hypothetical protein [Paludibacteraceae bacterium]MBR0065390.1 hypothetical protein [Paludibacteraceae bacterium]
MTDEEKKAQEAAAEAAAAAEQAGGETGGEAGSQAGDGGDGGNGGGEAAAAANAEEETGTQQEEKLPKELLYERVRTSFPDGKYDEDEQEYYRKLTEMLDNAETGNKKYNEFTEKLMRRYKDDPEEVAILLDYIEGMPLIQAIVKHKGEEALTMREGDEGWEGYQQAVQTRNADRERYMGLMEEVKGNLSSTVKEFNEWADELQLDDEKRTKVWEIINDDLNNISRGKFSKEILNRYRSALDHDTDVEGAYEQGKADGKNEAIDAKREQMKGSGLPNGNGGGKEHEEKEEKKTTDPTAAWLESLRHK